MKIRMALAAVALVFAGLTGTAAADPCVHLVVGGQPLATCTPYPHPDTNCVTRSVTVVVTVVTQACVS